MGEGKLNSRQAGKTRQSNFELLRIIAMLMIVASHFALHGGLPFPTDRITIPRLWAQLLQMGGKLGADLFVLISGYFLIRSPGVRPSRVLRLWLQLATYSLGLYALAVLLGWTPFSPAALLRCMLPVSFQKWWFASTYFVLYLISPLLNRFLRALDRRTYRRYLCAVLLLWSVIPTLTTRFFEGSTLVWFICLYSVAGYVRLWRDGAGEPPRGHGVGIVVLALLTYLTAVAFDLLGLKIPYFGRHATHFFDMHYLPTFALALLIFCQFRRIDLGCRRIVNAISATTFGVYLIHEDEFMRPFLWTRLFKGAAFAGTPMLIPYSVMAVVGVFVACACVEWLRARTLERCYMKWVDRAEPALARIVDRALELNPFDKL